MGTPLKSKPPTIAHTQFRDDMLAVLNKHAGNLDASDMLALCAYTVGQMLAMQDARKYSAATAMELVIQNIEAGNAQAIADAAQWMPRA